MSFNTVSKLIKKIGTCTKTTLLALVASGAFVSAQTPFVISSVSSGQVLDDQAFSTNPGTVLQQWPANGEKNQQWNLQRDGDFVYEITSVHSGLALGAQDDSSDAGAPIVQQTPAGAPSQLWFLSRVSTGYVITSQQEASVPCTGNLCLLGKKNLVFNVPGFSMEQGEQIQQWTENDGNNQQWLFHPQDLETMTVALSVPNQALTIYGLHFYPGIEVCPVLTYNPFGGPGPCTTVQSDGTFTITWKGPVASGITFASMPGYLVVTIEDKNQKVLAIGSVPGGLQETIP